MLNLWNTPEDIHGCSSIAKIRAFTLKHLQQCLSKRQNLVIKSQCEHKVGECLLHAKIIFTDAIRFHMLHFAYALYIYGSVFCHCFTLINKSSDSLKVGTRLLSFKLSFPFLLHKYLL